ncbi:MAG: DUF748 domain-containing protein [Balneolales bacterium]|nr:DUF748 domain-containing protein [Balneolales bacterium]
MEIRHLEASDFLADWDPSLFHTPAPQEPETEIKSDNGNQPAIRKIILHDFGLHNGTLVLRNQGEASERYSEIAFSGGFAFNSAEGSFAQKNRDTSVRVDTLGFYLSDERYRFLLADFRFSQQAGTVSLAALQLVPVGGYAGFMRARDFRTDMHEIDLRNLHISGIDDLAFLNESLIIADSVFAGSLSLDVSANLKLPRKPRVRNPKLLNQMVQGLPFHFEVGIIRIENGNISYSEEAADGFRPGTIRFSNTTANLRGIDTRSDVPAVLTAATYLQNHAELNTELRFTLSDGPFRLQGSGRLDPFDLKQLNSIFMDLAGVEITGGNAHEVDFLFEMLDDQASGIIRMHYEDLKIRPVDKDDHSHSRAGSIAAFLANEILLRSNNIPDSNGELKTGEIRHERNPAEDPFFKYLWQTLRSGIFDTMLRI